MSKSNLTTWISGLKNKACETCKENDYAKITEDCAKCVKFSNWKDAEG